MPYTSSLLRSFTGLALLLGCVAALSATALLAAEPKRPNFIVFVADDMAWDDCGAYGHPRIRTPNIDRLAEQGMRFDNAFLTCSSCSPSRSSILTARYPHNTGAEQLHWPLPADQVMWVSHLKAAGYWTASAGKWHLGGAAKSQFDQVAEGQDGKWQAAIRERPRDKPFFIWQAFYDPHRGYQKNTIPEPHTASDAVVPPYLPDVKATREDLAMYYDEITRLDGVVGEVLAEVEKQGETENTFVLFISDNGRPFPRCKTTLYDSGVKTPFIVKYPARVKPGVTAAGLVSAIDIGPTILQLAGISDTANMDGVSILPLLDQKASQIRSFIHAEHHWHDYAAQERGLRSDRFKYIRNYYPDLNANPPADAVRSPTFAAMQELRKTSQLTADQLAPFVAPRPEEELYDLHADPHELKNLVADPAYQQELEKMRQEFAAWQEATGDAIPQVRTPDEFDRVTGLPLKGPKNRTQRPELRAGKNARQ